MISSKSANVCASSESIACADVSLAVAHRHADAHQRGTLRVASVSALRRASPPDPRRALWNADSTLRHAIAPCAAFRPSLRRRRHSCAAAIACS